MSDQEQEPWQEPWPEKMYLLHPSIKTFGAMVSNQERREYVRADRIEELERERDGLFHRATLAEEWREHDKARAEAAEAKLAKAVAGLRPFAKAAETWEPDDGDSALGARIEHPHHGLEPHAEFTFGDLRHARAVLAELEGQP